MDQRDERGVAPPSPFIYHPTAWLLVVAACLYGFVTAGHVWYLFRGRMWCFWAMVVGALLESAGFVARAVSARDYGSAFAFIVQYLSLILAPSFLAAACYVVFGRILWWVTPREHRTYRTLWCPPQRVSLFLVAFDLGSFLVQLLGASSSAQAMQDKKLTEEERRDKREKGMTIMRLGLVLQVMCFVLFAVLGIRFLVVSRRWAGQPLPYGDLHARWKRLIWAVNVAATLILVRTVYRLFEFTQHGSTPGYIVSHEWLFWVLEGLPMFGVLVLFLPVHPSHYLPSILRDLRVDRKRLDKMEGNGRGGSQGQQLEGPIQATVYWV